MNDLFERMTIALPRVQAWIEDLIAEHTPRASAAADAGFPRLREYFGDEVLRELKVVSVKRIPVVPLTGFGLPEFAAVEHMAVSGITYRGMCFLHESMMSESTCFHELVHALQWKTLGWNFLIVYGIGLVEFGYARSPLEAAAFDYQRMFERGERVPDLAGLVASSSLDADRRAGEYLRLHGVVPRGV